MADALAARQQRISELQRLEMRVALKRLEPFGRVARAVLQLEDFEVPLRNIFVHRRFERQARTVEHLGQFDRIFERELGAGPDREMRGVRGVAEQDDIAGRPALALDAAEVEPCRGADQMRGVRLQRMAVEIFGEQLLAGGDRFGLVHAVEAETAPRVFRTFDDEGRAVWGEAVGVRPDPAVLGLLEREGEGVEDLVRSEPDELVRAHIDVDAERIFVCVAEARVDAVGSDDEIVVAPLRIGRIALGVELDPDAEFARPVLQYFEQALAADADEPVTRGSDRLAAEVDVDVVPMREFVGDDLRGLGVVGLEVLDRLVGEDHAPAEGDTGSVAFEHRDVVRGVAELHRDGEIEAGRTGADAGDLHPISSECSQCSRS